MLEEIEKHLKENNVFECCKYIREVINSKNEVEICKILQEIFEYSKCDSDESYIYIMKTANNYNIYGFKGNFVYKMSDKQIKNNSFKIVTKLK